MFDDCLRGKRQYPRELTMSHFPGLQERAARSTLYPSEPRHRNVLALPIDSARAVAAAERPIHEEESREHHE